MDQASDERKCDDDHRGRREGKKDDYQTYLVGEGMGAGSESNGNLAGPPDPTVLFLPFIMDHIVSLIATSA